MKIDATEYGIIEQASHRSAKEFQQTIKDIAAIHKRQTALTRQCEEKERTLSKIKLNRALLREALVLHNCVNAQHPLREEIMSAKECFERDDITVCEQRTLEKSIAALTQRLQAQCLHPLVVQSVDGHVGFHSNDYEDRHSAVRVYAFCGLEDSSTSSGDEIFRKLPKAEHRIVRRACFLDETPLVEKNEEKLRSWRPYVVHLWLPIETIVDAFFDDRICKLVAP